MHVARRKALKGQIDNDETWDLYYPDTSFVIWRLVDGMEWKHLPVQGGNILDVDEALLDDLLTISYVSQLVEAMIESNEKNEGT